MDVTLEEFDQKHGPKLDRLHMRARAVKIFKDCGPYASWKIDTLFENALEHNKVSKVINDFEEMWEEHLSKIPNLIDRQVGIRFAIDRIYGTRFVDVLEKRIGARVTFA